MSEKNEVLTLSKNEVSLFLLNKTRRTEIKKKSKKTKTKKEIFSVSKGVKTLLKEKKINTPIKLVSTPQKILQSKSTDCNTTPQIQKKKLRQISLKELKIKYDFDINMKNKDSMMVFYKKDYMEKLIQIDPRKRIILLDWIMEVCCLFNFKRETYHSTVVLIDNYLSQINDLQIKDYQLVGITCLLISAKNEEIIVPSVQNFAETTKFTYLTHDIINFEKEILLTLKWKIQNLNLCFWSDYYMKKWDDFVKEENDNYNNYKESLPLFFGNDKNCDLYKSFFLIIDTVSYEYYHIFKDMKVLVTCVLYFLIGGKLSVFNLKDIKNISQNEKLIEKYYNYNMFFNNFIRKSLQIEFIEGYFSYIALFFNESLFEIENDISFNDKYIQDYSRNKKVVAEEIEKNIKIEKNEV